MRTSTGSSAAMAVGVSGGMTAAMIAEMTAAGRGFTATGTVDVGASAGEAAHMALNRCA